MVGNVERHERATFGQRHFDEHFVRATPEIRALRDGANIVPAASQLAGDSTRDMLIEEQPHPGIGGVRRLTRSAARRFRSSQPSISAGGSAEYAAAASPSPPGPP